MKKILIWDYNINIANSGGPAGYLYNIKEYIIKHKEENYPVYFLKDLINNNESNNPIEKKLNKKSLKKKIINWCNNTKFLKQRIDALRIVKYSNSKLYQNSIPIDLNYFDIIHFHFCFDLLTAKNLLKDFKGKIILTSHSPQPASCEISEIITKRFSLTRFFIYKYLVSKELKSWSMADYLMFPVKEATEPYKINNNMKLFLETNKHKLLYCPSSILDTTTNSNKDWIFKQLNIPPDSFIITYVGRHNIIKGYDQLKKIGEYILKNNPKVYFVIAGNEYPIKRLNHCRWIELGWIDYGKELIANSDLFILPNKETYFDLITLEVLRAGTPILMTKTGGNKHFLSYSNTNTTGIFFYEYSNIEMASNNISNLIKLKETGEIDEIKNYNRQLFLTHFTVKSFLERYITCLNNI